MITDYNLLDWNINKRKKRKSGEFNLAINNGDTSSLMSVKSLSEQIKKELGFYDNPLKKCQYCGQWGAVMCACVKCGAPID